MVNSFFEVLFSSIKYVSIISFTSNHLSFIAQFLDISPTLPRCVGGRFARMMTSKKKKKLRTSSEWLEFTFYCSLVFAHKKHKIALQKKNQPN
jgi:hypothetical protein